MTTEGWCIYALGGGWGHLNRSLALAQVAARQRPVYVLTNSPYCDCVGSANLPPNLTLHPLDPTVSLEGARHAVLTLLNRLEYCCLIVDTFPRGLIGELVDLIPRQRQVCHVLIHRDLQPAYVRAKGIRSFVRSHYQGILLPGERDGPLADLPQAYYTDAWFSRDAADLPNPDVWRDRIGMSRDCPLILVCATGKPNELGFFGAMTAQLAIAFPTLTVFCLAAHCPPGCPPELWLSHWPGIDIVQLATVVIGGGGYNLVQECTALGIPLIAFAFLRRYDRQARRIQHHCHRVSTLDQAIDAVKKILAHQTKGSVDSWVNNHRRSLRYANGVTAAINQIQTWVRRCSR